MKRAYAAAVCVLAIAGALAGVAGCDRRGRTPAPDPVPVSTQNNPPAGDAVGGAASGGAAADQATTDLDSVDQVLKEVNGDLASADATPPDAD
jgi:hypothetical protein